MAKRQLNVWIDEELKNYIAERAKEEDRGMNDVIADLIRADIARRKGEFLQNNTLAVIQQMLATEIHRTHAQLRQDLREDREEETASLLEYLKKQFNRVAGLTIFATRNAGIARRLAYTSLSKQYGPQFAKEAYQHAKEKAQEELLPKKSPGREHMLPEEESEAL